MCALEPQSQSPACLEAPGLQRHFRPRQGVEEPDLPPAESREPANADYAREEDVHVPTQVEAQPVASSNSTTLVWYRVIATSCTGRKMRNAWSYAIALTASCR